MSAPFEKYGRTIRVEGGIRAQSTRGAIGESWWSKRFLAVLESFALGSRLTRGRSYARQGQVLSLRVDAGMVTAAVQGSRPQPYDVHIGLAVLPDAAWSAIEADLAGQALYSARLLAGEMPRQIEDVFDAAGTSVFPTGVGQLDMRCSCPDWQVPCKHLAATFYLLAEAFDADPFQILHWRGRDRQTLLARLRTLRSGPGPADEESGDRAPRRSARTSKGATPTGARSRGVSRSSGRRSASSASPAGSVEPPPPPTIGAAIALADLASPDLADTVDRFWVAPVPLPPRPPTLNTEVDLLLRQLPAPDAVIGATELTARLRTLYAALPPPAS